MLFSIMEMFISFFSGKVMLFYGITLIMKEKSNASALLCSQTHPSLLPDTFVSAPRRECICRQTHSHTGRYSPSGIGEVLAGIGRASSRGPSRHLPCVLPERCIASVFPNACG